VIEIKKVIDEYILQNQETWQKKRVYASDIGKCKRSIYYALKPELPKAAMTAKSRRRMDIGKYLQDYEARALKEYKILVCEEMKLDSLLGAKIDWVLRFPDPETGEMTEEIVEVKSLSEWDIRALNAALDPLAWVRKDKKPYLFQLLYYLSQLPPPEDNGCVKRQGRLHFVGVNGDTFDIQVKPEELPEDMAAMQAEVDALLTYNYSNGEPPAREGKPGKGQCSYCDYREHCWAGAKPEETAITLDDEEIVLKYKIWKEAETKAAELKAEIYETARARVEQREDHQLVTPIGGLKLQVSKRTTYKDKPDELRAVLEPFGLFDQVLEISDSKVKEIIKAGYIKQAELEPAITINEVKSLVEIKEEK